jgi:ABC-type transport system involved in cytochrome bd biosynthesis fused ATPase/permease subunit
MGSLLNRPVEPGWSEKLPAYNGPGRRIQLRRLSYRGQDGHWILRDFHAVIKGPGLVTITDDGRHVGRVLLELLMRLRRPHKGRIRFDRIDARKLSVASIRRQMGWLDRDRRAVNVVSFALGTGEWACVEERLKKLWPQTECIAPNVSLAACVTAMRSLSHRSWNDARLARDARLRFAVCCALVQGPSILLMDDPTRDLDGSEAQQFIDWLAEAALSRLIIAVTADPRLLSMSRQTVSVPSLSQEVEVEKPLLCAAPIGALAGFGMCADLPASSSVQL